MSIQDRGRAAEVLAAFAWLGVTSFGGPVAHIGYFRNEFVTRRAWLSERAFADLVGLCQFLPGPASSQLGFSLGLMRAGIPGGLAAWCGFTLPSALLLALFAFGAGPLSESPGGQGLLHGLKLVAVAIVAQAVWSMAQSLCPDVRRAAIALLAAMLALAVPSSAAQISAIVAGAMTGFFLCREPSGALPEALTFPISRRTAQGSLLVFAMLLALSLIVRDGSALGRFDAFYRSGALVFGGGHVVLPLLSGAVVDPGWIDAQSFLAGYGAAQAVPGPLFTFSAYLGARMNGVPGAALALVAIFLPGLLMVAAALPYWSELRARPSLQAVTRGVNAAVVGILGAALYTPVSTSAIGGALDFAVASAGFILLVAWKIRPILVVALCALLGVGMAYA